MKKLPAFGLNRISRFIGMNFLLLLLVASSAKTSMAQAKMMKDPDVIGRWDITMSKEGKDIPSWLEVQKSGTHTLIGRFTYAFGSARPISEVKVNDGKYSFSIPPQWEQGTRNMDFEFEVSGNDLITRIDEYFDTAQLAPLMS